MIEWNRFVKPQEDGYDTWVLATCLQDRYGWTRQPAQSPFRLCHGQVAIVPDPRTHGSGRRKREDYADRITAEEVETLDRLLAAWPTGYLSLSQFLEEFYPKWWVNAGPHFRGSCSGHLAFQHGGTRVNVDVTINDRQACAAGIYHEVAHVRLESVGMDIDAHDGRLIANGPDELYESPVRYDTKRPMCAVIHGLYAWVMLTEDHYACALAFDPRESCEHYISSNIPKIECGIEEVRRHVRPTTEGVPFVDALLEWSEDLVERGNRLVGDVLGEEHMRRRRDETLKSMDQARAAR